MLWNLVLRAGSTENFEVESGSGGSTRNLRVKSESKAFRFREERDQR
jgi:hypothetical protein